MSSDTQGEQGLFKQLVSEKFGRYLIASQDIDEGQLILEDEFLVIGPQQASVPVCLGCNKKLELCTIAGNGIFNCSKCHWPLCSKACEDSALHKQECAFLKKRKIKPGGLDFSKECTVYDCITPLRVLLNSRADPAFKEKLGSLEKHNDHRKQVGIWAIDDSAVVGRIRCDWKASTFSAIEIQNACAALEVNSFEIPVKDSCVRGLAPVVCIMAHSCIPNTCLAFSPSSIKVYASRPIPSGAMITASYAFTLEHTAKRRDLLKTGKFFDCDCPRCADPSELDTHLSTVMCPDCKVGLVMSDDPLDVASFWSCRDCKKYKVRGLQILRFLGSIQMHIDDLPFDDIETLLQLIASQGPVLHPNHAILLGLKHYLISALGYLPGYSLRELSESKLKLKVLFCNQIVSAMEKLEPNISKMCGLTHYEKAKTLTELLKRRPDDKTASDLRETIQSVQKHLCFFNCEDESAKILKECQEMEFA